jgi:hypothetical protein
MTRGKAILPTACDTCDTRRVVPTLRNRCACRTATMARCMVHGDLPAERWAGAVSSQRRETLVISSARADASTSADFNLQPTRSSRRLDGFARRTRPSCSSRQRADDPCAQTGLPRRSAGDPCANARSTRRRTACAAAPEVPTRRADAQMPVRRRACIHHTIPARASAGMASSK